MYAALTSVATIGGGFIWYLLRNWIQNVIDQIHTLKEDNLSHNKILAEHTTEIAVLDSQKIGREELRENLNQLRRDMKTDMVELKTTVKEDNSEIKSNIKDIHDALNNFMRHHDK